MMNPGTHKYTPDKLSPMADTKDFKARQIKIKEIHKPSSFEGALWAVQGITDARVIYHAPPGCYLMQHMNALCNEWHPEIYSTLVSYAEVMQGTGEKLDAMVKQVVAEKPKAIIVITSPVIEITGDDVQGAVAATGYENLIVIRPPLGGTLAEGKEGAFLGLMDLMKPARQQVPRTVNLIGPTYNTFNWRADVFELTRMLSAIGVNVNAVIAADCTVAQIERAPQAALNVCVYPYDCGIVFAQRMEQRYGTPFKAAHVPIGYRESAAWLSDIAAFFSIEAQPYIAREVTRGRDFITTLLVTNTFFEAQAALSTDNCDTYSVGISSFLNRELGMKICMAAVSTEAAAAAISHTCANVLVNPSIDEKKNLLLELSPTIILGNYYDLKIAADLGFKNFLFADIPLIGYIFSETTPFMGFMGAQHLVQAIGNEIYTKIFIETKGELEGAISAGEIPWELDAERALGRIAELLPHFIRSIALKKIHQVADETALQRNSPVTLEILQDVALKYTPTRFKAKYATIFNKTREAAADSEYSAQPVFTMCWEQAARDMLAMVPAEFRAVAAQETENYAREHQYHRITAAVVEEYRKKLGF
jgi:light-independent protochlorophyllide reductase B subunit